MNTIPKLEINQNKLEDSASIKDAYFQDQHHEKTKFFWSLPGKFEIAGIDLFISSDFKNIEEFHKLSNYYQKILDSVNANVDIPLIFIGSSFNMKSKAEDSTWTKMPRGKIFIPKCLYINNGRINSFFTINYIDSDYQIEPVEDDASNQELKIQSETSKKDFYDMIEDSKNLIDSTELEKIVISRKKTYDFDF